MTNVLFVTLDKIRAAYFLQLRREGRSGPSARECASEGPQTRTMGLGYGAAIFGFAIGYPAILLGGMTFIARRWGEPAVGPWIV